jgi:hypothetical protein
MALLAMRHPPIPYKNMPNIEYLEKDLPMEDDEDDEADNSDGGWPTAMWDRGRKAYAELERAGRVAA